MQDILQIPKGDTNLSGEGLPYACGKQNKEPVDSIRSKDRLPILGIRIDLGKPLGSCKEQEVIEVGKGPQLGRSLPLRSRVATEVKAALAAVDDGPDVGAPSLSSSDIGAHKCLRELHPVCTPQPLSARLYSAFLSVSLLHAPAKDEERCVQKLPLIF